MNKCSFCFALFWKQADMEAHIANNHIKKFDCTVCGMSFKSKSTLRIHFEYDHEGKEKDQCNICKKEFIGKSKLNIHIASVHEGKKPFLCSECGYASAFNSELKVGLNRIE